MERSKRSTVKTKTLSLQSSAFSFSHQFSVFSLQSSVFSFQLSVFSFQLSVISHQSIQFINFIPVHILDPVAGNVVRHHYQIVSPVVSVDDTIREQSFHLETEFFENLDRAFLTGRHSRHYL